MLAYFIYLDDASQPRYRRPCAVYLSEFGNGSRWEGDGINRFEETLLRHNAPHAAQFERLREELHDAFKGEGAEGRTKQLQDSERDAEEVTSAAIL